MKKRGESREKRKTLEEDKNDEGREKVLNIGRGKSTGGKE